MAITHGLMRALETAAREEAAAFKASCAGKVRAILEAVEPALTPLELAVGLELAQPDSKRTVVSRWLSSAPRYVRTVPDEPLRVLFERVLEGLTAMAVGPAVHTASGATLRQLTFCEPREATRLGQHWRVVRFAGAAQVVGAGGGEDADIDWSGGSANTPADPSAPTGATTGQLGFDPAEPLKVGPRSLAPGVMIPRETLCRRTAIERGAFR
jgi:hypothetical protein